MTNILKAFIIFFFLSLKVLGQENKPPEDTPEIILQKKIAFLQEHVRTNLQWNELDQAEKYLNQVIELEPENENSFLLKAALFVKRENFTSALEYAAKGFKNSKHRQIIYLIEKCNETEPASIKIREQSVAWVNEAKTINNNINNWFACIYAKAYLKNNDFKNTIEILQNQLKKSPNHFGVNEILANMYVKQGDYIKGMETLMKIMPREPKLAMCQNHIAFQMLTYDDESYNQPVIALSYALLASDTTEQKIEDIEDTIALAYYKTGDIKNACEAQKRAVENFKRVLPPHQINRSTKLKGFQRQLAFYEKQLNTKN